MLFSLVARREKLACSFSHGMFQNKPAQRDQSECYSKNKMAAKIRRFFDQCQILFILVLLLPHPLGHAFTHWALEDGVIKYQVTSLGVFSQIGPLQKKNIIPWMTQLFKIGLFHF